MAFLFATFVCFIVDKQVRLDGQAKPYQIKQFLNLIERYNLTMEE